MTCETCKHSILSGNARYCRRYPPKVVIYKEADGSQFSSFPYVKDDWKCGEYRVVRQRANQRQP